MSFVGVDSQYMSVPFPNLKRLDVLSYNSYHLTWKLPHGLNNLTKLRVREIDIAQEDAATFWNICTQLESLYLFNSHIPQPPEKSATFDHLVGLSVFMSYRCLRGMQAGWMNWIAQCPNVIALELDFHAMPRLFTDEFLVRMLLTRVWSKLEELRLSNIDLSDSELATVIEGMQKTIGLDILHCTFGELSLTALRRHYPHLRQLHSTATSPMIVEIMSSCPRLEYLYVGELMSQDVISSPPWICGSSLRCIQGCFTMQSSQDSDDHQRRVLRKVSELVSLEHISLINSDDDADENTTKLHLGLENGLEQLITLQKLDTLALLNMDYNSKQLTEADVKWMASNWKNLKKVYGYLSIDNNKDLSAVLEEAGIGYDSSFWDAPQYRSPNSRHWLAKCDM
ncbi:hypothetical protein B0O80DRAFT_186671 [Mortierella sp. GBAus27b]|nr:hypothetical protein B0O80DRAFT_186671 [Mortierella sp. GBAus27b]